MFMSILTAVSFFSFGYCITDIIANRRANKRIEEFMKEFENK